MYQQVRQIRDEGARHRNYALEKATHIPLSSPYFKQSASLFNKRPQASYQQKISTKINTSARALSQNHPPPPLRLTSTLVLFLTVTQPTRPTPPIKKINIAIIYTVYYLRSVPLLPAHFRLPNQRPTHSARQADTTRNASPSHTIRTASSLHRFNHRAS